MFLPARRIRSATVTLLASVSVLALVACQSQDIPSPTPQPKQATATQPPIKTRPNRPAPMIGIETPDQRDGALPSDPAAASGEPAETVPGDGADIELGPPLVENLPDTVPVEPVPGARLVRAALLLPLTGPAAPVGEALFNAAQLAVFQVAGANFVLMPIDTLGTPDGAAKAAREAVARGADIILGPLFSGNVKAAAPVARSAGINIIAFTTDKTAAGDGVYVIGFLPDSQIERILEFARDQEVRKVAVLAPSTTYGQTVVHIARETARRADAELKDAALLAARAAAAPQFDIEMGPPLPGLAGLAGVAVGGDSVIDPDLPGPRLPVDEASGAATLVTTPARPEGAASHLWPA